MILAIDTSSALTSVAILDDDQVVSEAEHVDARSHGEVLAGLVRQVLRDADRPALIAIGVGPGPYTGLRVGVATAAALGLAWQVPVLGACSLDALALRLANHVTGPFVVASDARRREVYWARYAADGSRLQGPHVGPAGQVDQAIRQEPWSGEGAAMSRDVVAFTGCEARTTGADVARLVQHALVAGESVGPAIGGLAAHGTDDGSTADQLAGHRLLPPVPLYIRRPDAMGG